MSRHMSFIGQRADKILVTGLGEVREGIVTKKVHRYTVACPDCGAAGFYDGRGEIICDGCGMVLSGRPATVSTEYSNRDDGEGGGIGASRGLHVSNSRENHHGTHEPA